MALLVAVGLLGSAFGAMPAYGQDGCPPNTDGKNPIHRPNQTVIVGTPKSDHICGGNGPNIIIGGLLDDEMYGLGGDDIIIGGHGTDVLNGQSGDDWLRGGDNDDVVVGGDGPGDTASFADLTPVGHDRRGVKVDLSATPAKAVIGDWHEPQDGFVDDLHGIEDVVGTAFQDELQADTTGVVNLYGGAGADILRGTNNDVLSGELDVDQCVDNTTAVACDDVPQGGEQARPAGRVVYGETRGKDRGVVVLGSGSGDVFDVARVGDEVRVASTTGAVASRGTCNGSAPVTCPLAAQDEARYVVVWGDDGDDSVTFGAEFQLGPDSIDSDGGNRGTVDANGGLGSDTLLGGAEDELLFSGEEGIDTLNGRGGADALISEGSSGDVVRGGASVDQIVADNACAGHDLWGQGESDIIGFARQVTVAGEKAGVHAQLPSDGATQQAWAIRDGGEIAETEPEQCAFTTIRDDEGETLEGTEQHDVLIGNDRNNTIWGRAANDSVSGRGGNDNVRGHGGDDAVTGDNGADKLYGGNGVDSLDARDTPPARDLVINCGGRDDGDPRAQRDWAQNGVKDPKPIACNDPTQTSLSLERSVNGEPGHASVSGTVVASGGEPVEEGYVTVRFDRYDNGTWVTERTAQRALDNGHYAVEDMGLRAGQWRVRATFPAGQDPYVDSASGYQSFEIKHGYQVVARHSGKCLDVHNSSTSNSQAIHQRDCLDPVQAPNQVFSLVPESGALQLVARHSGKCVDVVWASHDPGAGLQQYECFGESWAEQQLWQRDQIAPGSPYFQLEVQHSDQCMDLHGGGTASGVRAVQWPCTDGRLSQHWELRPVNSSPIPRNVPPGGFDTVTHAAVAETSHGQPGYVSVTGDVSVTNAPGESADGAYLNAYFSKWENGQWVFKEAAHPTVVDGTYRVDNWRVGVGQWRVMVATPAQGPYNHSQSAYHEFEIKSGYEVVARHSGKCMTLVPNATESGGSIDQQTCTSDPMESGQVFTLVPMGGGDYQLKLNSTGKCLDVSWYSYDDGAYLQQWACDVTGEDNQLWKVVPVAGQDPYVTLQVKHSGKCADVAYGSADDWVFIQQWTCTPSYTHQHWRLRAVD